MFAFRSKILIGTSLYYTLYVCEGVWVSHCIQKQPLYLQVYHQEPATTEKQIQQEIELMRVLLFTSTQHKHMTECGTLINIYSMPYMRFVFV